LSIEYFYLNLQHKVYQNGKLLKVEYENSFPKLTTSKEKIGI